MKLLGLISTFVISLAVDVNKVGFYKYCDGFTFTYIDLKENASFKYYYRSCTGDNETTGSWRSIGDTIFLNHNSGKCDTFVFAKDKLNILHYNAVCNFQPYSKMKSKNTKDKSDCCKSCYERQKK